MKGNLIRKLATLLLVAMMALVAMGPAPAARAGNVNRGVIPPNATPYGHTYPEWSAKWWQWALSIPTPVNPLIDETGANCAEGQSGPVWFLAPNFGGTTVRTCTIPNGKAILFEIMFTECSTVEPDPWHGDNEAELRACARGWEDQVTEARLSIDGSPLQDVLHGYRFQTPLYTFWFPEENLFGVPGPGTGQSVADAVVVMLHPLSTGQHTIHMTGNAPWNGGTNVDVTYNLTVGR